MRASAIRRLVASALEADGFGESRWVYARIGSDPQARIHRTFATSIDAISDEDRPRGQGRIIHATLSVQVVLRIRADSQVEDMDTAYDLVEDADNAVVGVSRVDGLHIWPDRRDLRSARDGTFAIATLTYNLRHLNHYTG